MDHNFNNSIEKTLVSNIAEVKGFEVLLKRNLHRFNILSSNFLAEIENHYWNIISSGLERISFEIMSSTLQDFENQACILPSYSSSFVVDGSGNYTRIYPTEEHVSRKDKSKDFKAIAKANSGLVAAHVNYVLNQIWGSIPSAFEMAKNEFTIHDFAQLKLSQFQNRKGSKRVPVLITVDPKLLQDTDWCCNFSIPNYHILDHIASQFQQFANNGRVRAGIAKGYNFDYIKLYVSYMLLFTGNVNEQLENQIIDNLTKYQVPKKSLSTILKRLKKEKELRSLNLTTISISDELSDEPLGTVMVWSKKRSLNEKECSNIHEICFKYFDAMRKIDGRMKSSLDEHIRGKTWLDMLAAWVVHEIKSLTVTTKEVELKNISISTFRTNSAIVGEISNYLLKLANYQNKKVKGEFLLSHLRRLFKWEDAEVDIPKELRAELPDISRLIIVELVRNAYDHYLDTTEKKYIKIKFKTQKRGVIISVTNRGKLLKNDLKELNKPIDFETIPPHPGGTWLIKWALNLTEIGHLTWSAKNGNVICDFFVKLENET